MARNTLPSTNFVAFDLIVEFTEKLLSMLDLNQAPDTYGVSAHNFVRTGIARSGAQWPGIETIVSSGSKYGPCLYTPKFLRVKIPLNGIRALFVADSQTMFRAPAQCRGYGRSSRGRVTSGFSRGRSQAAPRPDGRFPPRALPRELPLEAEPLPLEEEEVDGGENSSICPAL